MDVTRCSIQGAKPQSFIKALKEEIFDCYLFSTDHVTIFTTEKYFLRTNSNLLSVIIVDCTDQSRITIEIISGGGGSGLLQMGLGSEESANKQILKICRKICDSNSWSISEN